MRVKVDCRRQECKELAPDLWDEYTALLRDGETMANRPDLVQELGTKLQPLLDAKMKKSFADAKERGIDVGQDERAWNAIDNFSSDSEIQESSKPPPSEPSIRLNQWDDDDDNNNNNDSDKNDA